MGKKVFIWVIIKAREKAKLEKFEIFDIIFLLNFNFVLNMA